MPKNPLEKYCCPRCGYDTDKKPSMRNHLYKRGSLCPALKRNIELTEYVKEYIMANRIYNAEEAGVGGGVGGGAGGVLLGNTFNTIVNNYNMQSNLISRMDTMEKLTHYTNFKKADLIGIEDKIENTYSIRRKKLENNSYKYGFELGMDDLLETVNEVSRLCSTCKNFEDFNMVYEKRYDKLNLYEGDQWEEMMFNRGIKVIIEKIQACFLYAYECYLLRKIENEGYGSVVSKCKELLDEYFKFIGCFDIYPYLWKKTNNEILYNEDDPRHMGGRRRDPGDIECFRIADYYGKRYIKIRDETTKSDLNQIKKSVMDIVKKNSLQNSDDLNRKVLELFNMEDQFKKLIIEEVLAVSSGNLPIV